MNEGSFSEVIADHLELARRSVELEPTMPLAAYKEQPAAPRPAGVPVSGVPTEPVSVHEPLTDPSSWWDDRPGWEG